MNIYKIVLTGGPCAGKTEVINNIITKLEKEDYYITTIPETASYLISNKMLPQGNKNHTLKFQELVLIAQTTKEQIAKEYCQSLIDNNSILLKNKKGIIILCDRGIMDNRAYLSQQDYNNLLKKYNYNELELFDSYDLAINLISTATAKPEAYELNGIRYETKEEAAKKDQITSGAWLLHQNLKTIKPTETIEEKIDIVFSTIMDFIKNNKRKESTSLEINPEKSDFSIFNEDNSRKIKITSFYMHHPNNTEYILDRRQYNDNLSFTIKKNTPNAEYDYINYETYNQLLKLNLLEEISKEDITYFTYNGNNYCIVENTKGMKLCTDKNNIDEIPKNIILKKTLIK